MTPAAPVVPLHPLRESERVRVVTAASLFDGHDAAINIMRRLLQAQGAEVIHLGHDRSVEEIAVAAVQEDARAVAVSSYQGGHMEFFGYLSSGSPSSGGRTSAVYGGGGGTITADEARALEARGVGADLRAGRRPLARARGHDPLAARRVPQRAAARARRARALAPRPPRRFAQWITQLESAGEDDRRGELAQRARGAPHARAGARDRLHRDGRRRQVERGRRARAAAAARATRRERGAACSSTRRAGARRRAARRPHPHERDPRPAHLRAQPRHAPRAPRALAARSATRCACCRPPTSTS
jgi:methylmalonyl-CoA mutase cobalamin-binding domain/chain